MILNVFILKRPVLFLNPGGVCIWTCLHYRGVYCFRRVSATGPELHLDVSALQRNVLLLEVSTLQGPELHLDVSAL